ncbi:hypothetical protein [Thiocystis violacea]|uniref:hypothetical protein n=1 Tax=Thiocystis violacea TaxID=13725 RepID=UPI00190640B4|nr:hypothetical protein [Thiocystis violacea]
MLISSKPRRRGPDPLILLMVFVVVGLCATISYQVVVYSDASQSRLVRQAPPEVDVGG